MEEKGVRCMFCTCIGDVLWNYGVGEWGGAGRGEGVQWWRGVEGWCMDFLALDVVRVSGTLIW